MKKINLEEYLKDKEIIKNQN